jgi:hypothetical protein
MFSGKCSAFKKCNSNGILRSVSFITTITIKKNEYKNMNTTEKKEFQLIDSTFTPEEANSLLASLIANKINYHKIDDFSNHIRYDRDSGHSRKRVEELQKTKEELTEFTREAKRKGVNVVVTSRVYIEYSNNVSE